MLDDPEIVATRRRNEMLDLIGRSCAYDQGKHVSAKPEREDSKPDDQGFLCRSVSI